MELQNYIDTLRTVITFLLDNEQYGDDWSEEILALNDLLDELQEKGGSDGVLPDAGLYSGR